MHARTQCFCGSEAEFNAAETSGQCGDRTQDVCSGDSTQICGGRDSLSIYLRIATPTPAPVTPAPVTKAPTTMPVTPAPVTPKPVTPVPVTPAPTAPYVLEGCYGDDKYDRTFSQLPVLVKKTKAAGMTIEVSGSSACVKRVLHERCKPELTTHLFTSRLG